MVPMINANARDKETQTDPDIADLLKPSLAEKMPAMEVRRPTQARACPSTVTLSDLRLTFVFLVFLTVGRQKCNVTQL